MTIRGAIKVADLGGYRSLPLDNPLFRIPPGGSFYQRQADILTFNYRTDGKKVAQMLPEVFKLEDSPKAAFSVGRFFSGKFYTAALHSVEVEFEGQKFMVDVRQIESHT